MSSPVHSPPEFSPRVEEADFSIVDLAGIVWHRRRLVAVVALLVIVPAVFIQFLKPLTYTATASFRASSRGGAGGLSGLAAQFGLTVPGGGDAGDSPAFYVELIRSRAVLGQVADADYSIDGGRKASLATLLHIDSPDPVRRRNGLIKALSNAVGSGVSARTGIITVSVTLEDRRVAQQVASSILDALNRFNLQGRQSQAATERTFVQQQLAQAGVELRESEDRLTEFRKRNRNTSSPDLALEEERLGRAVDLKQRVYETLAQAFEEAKINEVRNTPSMTVLERPEVPLDPNARGRLKGILFASLGGVLLGGILALVRERLSGFQLASLQRRSPTGTVGV